MSDKALGDFRFCWIQAFLSVIDNEGVEARAADELGLDASTVNRYLGHLEDWLGKPLFNGNLPKELNNLGVMFEGTAREIVSALSAAQKELPVPPPRAPTSAIGIKITPRQPDKAAD